VWAVAGIAVLLEWFLQQHRGGLAAGGAELPIVELVHELLEGLLNLRERVILGSKVGVLGGNVGLGQLDGPLRIALGSRVRRLTRQHRHAAVPGKIDRLEVPHRNNGDMRHGECFLLVPQDIGRCAANDPQRPIQRREHRWRCPVTQHDDDDDDDAKSRPRQARHEQHCLLFVDDRTGRGNNTEATDWALSPWGDVLERY